MKTETQKMIVAAWTAALFVLVSLPYTYQLTNQLTSQLGLDIASQSGCPNLVGVGLHSVVFLVLVRLMMYVPVPGGKDKDE